MTKKNIVAFATFAILAAMPAMTWAATATYDGTLEVKTWSQGGGTVSASQNKTAGEYGATKSSHYQQTDKTSLSHWVVDGSREFTFYAFAKPADGYKFVGWFMSDACEGAPESDTVDGYKVTFSVKKDSSDTKTYYAKFVSAASKVDINDTEITLTSPNYTGSAQTTVVTVKYGSTTLNAGVDYTVSGDSLTQTGSALSNETYKVIINAVDGSDYTGSATNEWKILAPSGSFAADALSTSAPGCTVNGTTNKVTESTALVYDADLGGWKIEATIAVPYANMNKSSRKYYTKDEVVATLGDEKSGAFVCETKTQSSRTYVADVKWTVGLTIADIKAAKESSKTELRYELTIYALANTMYTSGLKPTTYKIVVPIDENLVLNDANGDEVYPNNHKHLWDIAAACNVLTASCTNESTECSIEGGKITLTLTAEDQDYTGNAPTVSLDGKDDFDQYLKDRISYGTITYEKPAYSQGNDQWYTGDYAAVVTVTVDSVNYELTKAFRITKPQGGYTDGYEAGDSSTSVRFDSFSEAVAQIGAGGTVYYRGGDLKQQTFDFSSDKNITVDLGGKTLTYGGSSDMTIKNEGVGTVTFVNGEFQQPKKTWAYDIILSGSNNGGSFVFGEGVEFSNVATTKDYHLKVEVSNLSVVISNGTYQAELTKGSNGSILIAGGKFGLKVGSWSLQEDGVRQFLADDRLILTSTESGTEYFTVIEHHHAIAYGAVDNVITCACTAVNHEACGVGIQTLTLTATNVSESALGGGTYEGASIAYSAGFTPQTAVIVYYTKDDQANPLTGAPSDAGEYVAQVTVEGATAKAPFAITHTHAFVFGAADNVLTAACTVAGTCDSRFLAVTLVAEDRDWQKATPFAASVTDGFGETIAHTVGGYVYYKRGSEVPLEGAPILTGDYTVTLTVMVDSTDYKLKKDFEITKPQGGYPNGFEIDGIAYDTFADAFAVVPANGTIICHEDFNLPVSSRKATLDVSSDKDISIDLDGKKVTADTRYTEISIKNGGAGNVSFVNGTFSQPRNGSFVIASGKILFGAGLDVYNYNYSENAANELEANDAEANASAVLSVAAGANLSITGGLCRVSMGKADDATFEISGGDFVENPEEFLADGYALGKQKVAGYPFHVFKHTHEYTFMAEGATLTMHCDSDCYYDGATTTLKVEDVMRDGKSHGATLDPQPGDGFPEGVITISYMTADGVCVNGIPSEVGEYIAIATAPGGVAVKVRYRITDGRPFDLSAIVPLEKGNPYNGGRFMERSTLTVTNGMALKYYAAGTAPDGSGEEGWYVGMTVTWPNENSLIQGFSRLEDAKFTMNGIKGEDGEKRVFNGEEVNNGEAPGLSVEKFGITGTDFNRITSFTWYERITVADVKAAVNAGKDTIEREVTAWGEKWSEKFVITYGDDDGVAQYTFKIVVSTNDLVLSDGTYTYWPEHTHDWSYDVDDHHSITATCSIADCPYSVGVWAEFGPKTVASRLGSPEPLEAEFFGIEKFVGATDATVGEIEYWQGETKLDAAPIEPGRYVAKVVLTLADGTTTYDFMTSLEVVAGEVVVDGQHYEKAESQLERKYATLITPLNPNDFNEDLYISVGKDFTAGRAYEIPGPTLKAEFSGMATKYFDLNGFSITGAVDQVFLENKGKLVLSDSSEGQTGRMVANPENTMDVPLIINRAGKATKVLGADVIETYGAELTIESGIYLGMISNEVGEVAEELLSDPVDLSGKIVIKGGKFLYRPERAWLDKGCYIVEETLDDGTPVFAVYPHQHEYKFVSLGSLAIGYCTARDEGQGLLEPSSCQAKVVLMSAFMLDRAYNGQPVECGELILSDQLIDVLYAILYGDLAKVNVSGSCYVNLSAVFSQGFLDELVNSITEKTLDEATKSGILDKIKDGILSFLDSGREKAIDEIACLTREQFVQLTGATVEGPKWTTNASLIDEIVGGEDKELEGAPKDAGRYKVCFDILTPSTNTVSVKSPFEITPLPIAETTIMTEPNTDAFVYSGNTNGYAAIKVYSPIDGELTNDVDYVIGNVTNATKVGDYFFQVIGLRNYEGVTNVYWSIIEPVREFPKGTLEPGEEGDEPYGFVSGSTFSVTNAPAIVYSVADQGWWIGYTINWPCETGNMTLPKDADLTITYPSYWMDGEMLTIECTATNILDGTVDFGEEYEDYMEVTAETNAEGFVTLIALRQLITPEDLYCAHVEGKMADLTYTIKAGCRSTETNPEGLKKTDFSLVVPLGNLELYDVNGYRVFPNHLHKWEFTKDEKGWRLEATCTADVEREGECPLEGDPWMTLGRYANEEIAYTGKPVAVRKMNEWEFRFATGALVGEVEYAETNGTPLAEAPIQVGTYIARVTVTPMARKDGEGNAPYVLERTFRIVKPLFGYTDGFEVKSTERRYDTYQEAVAALTGPGDTIYCREDIEKADIDLTTPYDVTLDLCDGIITADAEMTIKNTQNTTVTLENGTVIQPRHYALKIIQQPDQATATGKFVFGRAFRLRNVSLLPTKYFTVTIPENSSLVVTGGSYNAKFEGKTDLFKTKGNVSITGGLFGMNFKPENWQIASGYEVRNALGDFAYIVVEKGLSDEAFTQKLADSVVESIDNDVVRGKLADILAKSAINAQEIFNWIKEKIGDLRQNIQQDIADVIERLFNSNFLRAAFDLNTGLLDGQEVAIRDYAVAEDEITFRVMAGTGDSQEVVQTTAAKIAPYVQVSTSLAEPWTSIGLQSVRVDVDGLVHIIRPLDSAAYVRIVLPKD